MSSLLLAGQWLIPFHGIMPNRAVKEYSVGAALLDLDEPWKARHDR